MGSTTWPRMDPPSECHTYAHTHTHTNSVCVFVCLSLSLSPSPSRSLPLALSLSFSLSFSLSHARVCTHAHTHTLTRTHTYARTHTQLTHARARCSLQSVLCAHPVLMSVLAPALLALSHYVPVRCRLTKTFSTLSFITVGDKYGQKQERSTRFGGKQFATTFPKQGRTANTYFTSECLPRLALFRVISPRVAQTGRSLTSLWQRNSGCCLASIPTRSRRNTMPHSRETSARKASSQAMPVKETWQ